MPCLTALILATESVLHRLDKRSILDEIGDNEDNYSYNPPTVRFLVHLVVCLQGVCLKKRKSFKFGEDDYPQLL